MATVILAHGLEGSPNGAKATYLRDHGWPDLVTPDGQGQPLAPRVATVESLTTQGLWIGVGSSYGGLAMLSVASRFPERFQGLLLLAPALMWAEPPVDDPAALCIPASLPCTVIHSRDDRVVPLSVSEALVDRCPHVRLQVVEDGHALRGSLPAIAAALQALCQ